MAGAQQPHSQQQQHLLIVTPASPQPQAAADTAVGLQLPDFPQQPSQHIQLVQGSWPAALMQHFGISSPLQQSPTISKIWNQHTIIS